MKVKLDAVNCGDCLEGMAEMDAGSVDLVFADPPFNIGYAYDVYDDRKDYGKYLDWSRDWIKAVHRVLKPDGAFWLAIGDEYAAELKLIAQNDAGFICRSWVIWYYTFGVHCKLKFTRSHAHLFYFAKDRKRFTFNADQVRVPSARQLVYADRRANPTGRMPDDTWIIPPTKGEPAGQPGAKGNPAAAKVAPACGPDGFILRPQDIPESFQADGDVWYFSRVAGTFKERQGWHGCQMPEQLLGRIIKACSSKGELVLDPFTGSGTTLVVAKKLGRKFVGFELSPEYAKQARERLAAATVGDKLNGAEDPLTSAPRTGEDPNALARRRARQKRGTESQALLPLDAD